MVKETALAKKDENTAPAVRALQEAIEQESTKRQIIENYIRDNLKEGVDYGTIMITSRKTGKTTETKPTLFKAGSERICSLLKVTPKFKKDIETWEMLGSPMGTICYICELVNEKGKILGEGRGACTVGERNGDPNAATKMAEKRAQMDATIRSAGISDRFTQDLEDMATEPAPKPQPHPTTTEQPKPATTTNSTQNTPNNTQNTPKTPSRYTEKQKNYIIKLGEQLGYDATHTLYWVKQIYKVEHLESVSMDQMSAAIDKVQKLIEEKKKKAGLIITKDSLTPAQRAEVEKDEAKAKPMTEEESQKLVDDFNDWDANLGHPKNVQPQPETAKVDEVDKGSIEVEPEPKTPEEKKKRFEDMKKNLAEKQAARKK